MNRFRTGDEVGDLARGLFGPSVNVTAYKEDGSLDLPRMMENTREEMEKLSQDPEISIFILETLTGLSGLSQAMMEAPETEEMPWEAGGEPVPDSTEEETAP